MTIMDRNFFHECNIYAMNAPKPYRSNDIGKLWGKKEHTYL